MYTMCQGVFPFFLCSPLIREMHCSSSPAPRLCVHVPAAGLILAMVPSLVGKVKAGLNNYLRRPAHSFNQILRNFSLSE